eukprot:m51a1_g7718 phosphoribosylaminoimidazolecarboxamide formyltransferase-IMP cyclohydrolase, putative (590) ;mRNA; r:128253-130193
MSAAADCGAVTIRRALVSVFNKDGVVDLCRALAGEFGVQLLSTGGTAKALAEAGVPFQRVEDYTGAPEMFDGRVKTLHPKIHGGLLMRRSRADDVACAQQHGIEPIDLVVCNLYAFEAAAARPDAAEQDVVEMIDIGGPAMIRASAKARRLPAPARPFRLPSGAPSRSFADVAVVVDPARYGAVLAEMRERKGALSRATRAQLSRDAFMTTARYDAAIASWMCEGPAAAAAAPAAEGAAVAAADKPIDEKAFPSVMVRCFRRVQRCRYGENWDQRAAVYADMGAPVPGVPELEILHGKEVSYNNWLDVDAAVGMVLDFAEEAGAEGQFVTILKHATPCGVALDRSSQREAVAHALETDSLSAFGGIWGFNRTVEAATARFLITEKKFFIEVIVAPDYEPEALAILCGKRDLRVLRSAALLNAPRERLFARPELRGVLGGVLAQDPDCGPLTPKFDVVSARKPADDAEKVALTFAYRCSKWAKSNSAVFVGLYETGCWTLGVGTGQQSRVHVVRLAAQRAADCGHQALMAGSVMGTDSFFPFPDGLEEAVKAGAKAIMTPGGSMRDKDVIAAADRLGVTLVHCGKRVFRH